MKLKNILALVLALTMVFALAACGGGDNTTGNADASTSDTTPTGDVSYTVTVQDVLGNPYTENIIVLFLQNGQQVAMQPVNAEGAATKTLPAGTYDVQLQITQNAEAYHYADGLQVTAEAPALTVTLSSLVGENYETLSVNGMERDLYKLIFAADGTFQLEDPTGTLSGTYGYAESADGGYTVTDASGKENGMAITLNLDGSFGFYCEGMSYAQQMVPEDETAEGLTGTFCVVSNEYIAYHIGSGCTYLEINSTERNYVIFTPQQSGIFEIAIHNATASVGYYGSPYFVTSENSGAPTGDQSLTVEIKESMIGTNGTGTVQLVIGIDAAADTADCIISVQRIGDCVLTPEEMPWEAYETDYVPTKYTLPEGLTIQEFDLTASYTLVFNETDGFYHLDSADGPIVLVRMDETLTYGGCFGNMLAGMNVGVYFYDEDGSFLRKELYNDCLLQYLGTLNKGMGTHSYSDGMLDDTHGVYPLTQDLMYIIQTYGAYAGWWRADSNNYLFTSLSGLNEESAWLFMCCYAG